MGELKPCPFCGGNARMSVSRAPICYVVCSLCNTCGPVDNREDGAITAWNRRATHPQPVTPAGGEVDRELVYRAIRSTIALHAPEGKWRTGPDTLSLALECLFDDYMDTHPPVADAALLSRLNALAGGWERAANVMKVAGNIRRYPEDYIGELRAVVKDAALNQRGGDRG